MKTNHDSFENDLLALRRRELPGHWRDEMLQAAATETTRHGSRTPRWLVAGWSLAWAAILLMYHTMPSEPQTRIAPSPDNLSAAALWQQHNAAIEALLAAN
ncbi:hypothetical protein [Prosthecobacter sp.]|uniref:hypothetical protein n=1 Tax=Prosthecobacter sp. TaxID=1965333 RepID=UPI001DD65292|nr:hypothetical protein [Prosthecobacter sp.]MCB1279623.1 hypothetical protein [Prosthecobacter sp.]